MDHRGANRPNGAVILKSAPFAVTEAESAILAALWKCGPLSFTSLIEEVRGDHPWADATIKTLLHRLMQKGAIKSVKDDGRHLYHAQIGRDAYVEGEVAQIVQRLFEGDPGALAAFLSSRRD